MPVWEFVLLPQPRQLTFVGGEFEVTRTAADARRTSGPRDDLLGAGRVVREALGLIGGVSDEAVIEVDAARVSEPEGYELSILPDGIQLVACDEAGAFYGSQTLLQIARHHEGRGRLPCLVVRDWPDLRNRAVQLDISRRRIPTMASLKLLVDRLAHLKINQFQLYTEHTFAYRNHRAVWGDYSPMTGEQILELDLYCRERHIELVPNQNTFGHMERWLHRPQYEHLAEGMPGTPIQYYLSPSDPRSLELVEELLDELLPHFSSRQVMVGLDEVTLGPGGRSASLCAERGGPGQVYLDYLLEVHRIVSGHGRTMMYFADMMVHYEHLLAQAPRDAIGLIWGYDEDFPFATHCAKYAERGIPFYTVPSTCCTGSIGGRIELGKRNMTAAVEAALEFGGSGCLVCTWGDGGYWQPLAVSMAGHAYAAGVMWHLEGNGDIDLAAALDAHVYGDRAAVMGKLSVELGRSCEQLPTLAGWSAYQTILQQKGGGHEQMLGISAEEFDGAEQFIAKTVAPLADARMECADAAVAADEFRVAAGLMRHACHLGKARLRAKGAVLPDLPEGWGLSHIMPQNRTATEREAEQCHYWPDRPGDNEIPTYGGDDLRSLADELEPLIDDYRQVWLARNRPGGLDESAARFSRLLELYRSGQKG